MSAVRPLVDVAGRPRSPATMPGFHAGRAPRNKGQRYPADPPTVDEIVAVPDPRRALHHALTQIKTLQPRLKRSHRQTLATAGSAIRKALKASLGLSGSRVRRPKAIHTFYWTARAVADLTDAGRRRPLAGAGARAALSEAIGQILLADSALVQTAIQADSSRGTRALAIQATHSVLAALADARRSPLAAIGLFTQAWREAVGRRR
jgi:hypothetical protein